MAKISWGGTVHEVRYEGPAKDGWHYFRVPEDCGHGRFTKNTKILIPAHDIVEFDPPAPEEGTTPHGLQETPPRPQAEPPASESAPPEDAGGRRDAAAAPSGPKRRLLSLFR